jgi:hypothetical protein
VVFTVAATGIAAAGDDATHGDLGHGFAARDQDGDRAEGGYQMAERPFDQRQEGGGHPDGDERGTGSGTLCHHRHRRGCEPDGRGISGGVAEDSDVAAELATEILHELDVDYGRVLAGKFAAVADEWEAACVTIGRNVTVHTGDLKFKGRAESLDEGGALLVRTEHGHLETVIGGDVMLEK